MTTSVLLRCAYASTTIDLTRFNPPKPADTLHVNQGTFFLPIGRLLTMTGTTYGNDVSIEAVDGDILVDGVRLTSGDKMTLNVKKAPIVMRAA